MKNIEIYKTEKYDKEGYSFVEQDIFLFENKYDSFEDGMYVYGNYKTSVIEPDYYVTSLSFEQEPDFDEGSSPKDISQYPLEDILDKFIVHVEDAYTEENNNSEKTCYIEFASPHIECIRELKTIVGKRVYNKVYTDEDGLERVKLVIE